MLADSSWIYRDITFSEIHLPLLWTRFPFSVVSKSHVAPPARILPRSRALCCWVCDDGKPRPASTDLKRARSVWPDEGHSFWWLWRRKNSACTRVRRSGISSLAAWCRAATFLVLGSWIDRIAKAIVCPTSLGSKRSDLRAVKNSPGRSKAPHMRPKAPAIDDHPQRMQSEIIPISTWKGAATWWFDGLTAPFSSKRSQGPMLVEPYVSTLVLSKSDNLWFRYNGS